jgi:hypothetical protein
MPMKTCISIAIAVLLAGCASVARKHRAEPIQGDLANDSGKAGSDLQISVDLRNDLSSEYFGYFDFNIMNNSDRWYSITDVKLSFPDSSQNRLVGVVLGSELASWFKAQKKSREIADYNRQLALGAMAGIGIGMAEAGDSKAAQGLGAAAALGSLTALGIGEMNQLLDQLQAAKMIPENHLLADTTLIPPGLFADKWILLNSRDHDRLEYITTLYLEYQVVGGAAEKQKMTFRKKYSAGLPPNWQAAIYRKNQKAKQP